MVVAGTLEALLRQFVEPHSGKYYALSFTLSLRPFNDSRQSVEYRDVFLSTYVAFTTADELLTRLLDLFHDTGAGLAQQRTEIRIKYVLVYLS